MLADAQFAARNMVAWVTNRAGVAIPGSGVVPKLSRTPGGVYRGGPTLGADTRAVLREFGGYQDADIDHLANSGVIVA
jgi:crotonobetainyl-CoA:carnitine CoA-transferase CaiB-like acyl-CoA transferase